MKTRFLKQIAICAVTFSLGATACEKRSIEPRGQVIRRAGNATSINGCLSGLMNSLSMSVRALHFRSACQRNSETGDFVWSFSFREELFTGDAGTYDSCVDRLATALNDNIPHMDIGLYERCTKRVKMGGSERMSWAYEYAGVL